VDLFKPNYATGYAKNASESANPNLWDGLVGAWMPSLGVTGETLRDVSGNGNHGTLTNMDAATDWVATSKGLALDFYPSSQSVTVPSDPKWSLHNAKNATISFYVNINSFLNAGTIQERFLTTSNNAFGAGSNWELGVYTTKTLVFRTESLFTYGTKTLTTKRWYHVVYRISGGSASFYLDGEKDFASSNVTQILQANNYPLIISGLSGRELNGQITGVSIYHRALSPSEIKQLYVDSLAPFKQRRRVIASTQAPPAFNNWYAQPGRKNRIIGSGVYV